MKKILILTLLMQIFTGWVVVRAQELKFRVAEFYQDRQDLSGQEENRDDGETIQAGKTYRMKLKMTFSTWRVWMPSTRCFVTAMRDWWASGTSRSSRERAAQSMWATCS